MPRVVADSDDEIDLVVISPPRSRGQAEMAIANPPPSTLEHDPLQNADFDQFLSPTQRLSTYDGKNDNHDIFDGSPLCTTVLSYEGSMSDISPQESTPATTNIAPSARGANMSGKSDKKRPHAALEQQNTNMKRENSRKKARIYGNNGAAGFATDFHNLITVAGSFETMAEPEATAKVTPHSSSALAREHDDTSPLDLSLSIPVISDSTPSVQANTISCHDASANSTHFLPSVQQYYQFDRSRMLHGTTTHSSVGGYQSFNIDHRALGGGLVEYNPFGTLSQVSLENEANDQDTRGIEQIFRNGSTRYDAKEVDIAEHQAGLENLPEMLTSTIECSEQQPGNPSPEYSPISVRAETPAHIDPISLDERIVTTKLPPKRRGRKPKAKPDSLSVMVTDDLDELQAEHYVTRSIRAGSIASVSNASDVSQTTSNDRKNKKLKKAELRPQEAQTKKMPSIELGLDSKEVIGLSPERYKPRPSRRRELSDNIPTVTKNDKEQDAIHAGEISVIDSDDKVWRMENDQSPAKSGGKKSRKAKVKKDKKPATSSAEISNESCEQRREDIAQEVKEDYQSNELVHEHPEEAKTADRSPKVSIDVPTLLKSESAHDDLLPVPEPRKRGRKRKHAVDEGNTKEEKQGRPALTERGVNIPAKSNTDDKRTSKVVDDDSDVENNETADVAKDGQKTEHADGTVRDDALLAESDTKSYMSNTKSPLCADVKASATPEPLSSAPTPLSWNNRARIGLSKRNRIPSLLQKINRNKEAPKVIERKEKLTKRQLEEREQERIAREEAEAEGREYVSLDIMRDKDGRLIEWDF